MEGTISTPNAKYEIIYLQPYCCQHERMGRMERMSYFNCWEQQDGLLKNFWNMIMLYDGCIKFVIG